MHSHASLTRQQWAALAALFALHILLSLQGIGELYVAGHIGWNGVLRSTIGAHYAHHGLLETGFAPYKHMFTAADLGREGIVHWNHPPTVNILVGLSFMIFGQSEAAAALVALSPRLGIFLALFAYVRLRSDVVTAFVAVLGYMLIPLQIEYGRLLNYESHIIFWTLCGLIMMEYARREEPPKWAAPLAVACVCIACTFDWPGFILAGFFGADALIRKPRKPVVFVAIGVLTALILGGFMLWLGDFAGPTGFEKLAERRSGGGVTLGGLANVVGRRFWDYFGWVVLLTAIVGAVTQARQKRLDATIVVFGLGGLLYFAVFKQAARVHSFYILIFMVPVLVAFAQGVTWLAERLPNKQWIALAVVLLLHVGWLFTQYPTTHLRTYEILPPKKPSKGFPQDGQLDKTMFGQWLNQNTKPTDRIAFHRSVNATIQMRYYTWRRYRANVKLPTNANIFVIGRHVPKPRQLELYKKYKTRRVLGYVVYYLDEPGLDFKEFGFKEEPTSFWHSYFVSDFYPAHSLQEDPGAAAKYLKSIGASVGK